MVFFLWLADVRDAFHVHLDWQRQEFSTWSDEINLRRSCLNGTNVSRAFCVTKPFVDLCYSFGGF